MTDYPIELYQIALVVLGLALGGLLKGATGAGAPLVAVPVIASIFDVRHAIVIMLVPNIVINVWQIYKHTTDRRETRKGLVVAIGTLPGVLIGTYLLTRLSSDVLSLCLALLLFANVVFRLSSPQFALSERVFGKIAVPMGVVIGLMQGTLGMSGPVALAFLNTLRLQRDLFIVTISIVFLATSTVQLPALYASGQLSLPLIGLSCLAILPILAMLPVGNYVGSRLSREQFNWLILAVISVLAVRLFWRAIA
ncbi:sulfite exporter TauE/SafE family protein [Roseisalinus antarcticus]|uniref:Probable membrane transporter protein n=1 Tax=Roseisalinus antarcticus TaxID=254357 RepID=A0A1Y5TJX6_9RHOB|nr:sulfite exporter TauE/SafE family protein [Roseisalinus antarcticus]SLN65352.1 Sulfite exporter TauE/SafE [Roseisalinus antarcticus]